MLEQVRMSGNLNFLSCVSKKGFAARKYLNTVYT